MRILVTGTTGGIGGAVSAAASARGWEVVGVNRNDFRDFEGLTISKGLDAIVFATGMCLVRSLTRTTDEDFAEVMAVNCGLFVKLMRKVVKEQLYSSAGMKVVVVSSVSAREGWPGGVAYCASKAALSSVCRVLDAELESRQISVRAVEPRHVRTRMFEQCAGRMGVDPAEAQPPEELAEQILSIF